MNRRGKAVETVVMASCERCGDVELNPSELELRLCSIPERSVYAFHCPECKISVIKPAADQRVVALLRSVGVQTVGWGIPAELLEPRDGEPISSDDIIDLMLELDDPQWIDRLTAVSSR